MNLYPFSIRYGEAAAREEELRSHVSRLEEANTIARQEVLSTMRDARRCSGSDTAVRDRG